MNRSGRLLIASPKRSVNTMTTESCLDARREVHPRDVWVANDRREGLVLVPQRVRQPSHVELHRPHVWHEIQGRK